MEVGKTLGVEGIKPTLGEDEVCLPGHQAGEVAEVGW